MSFLSEALEVAITAASEACATLKTAYTTQDFSRELKADGSPVTTADTLAQQLIERRLFTAFPEIPVIGEEAQTAVFKTGSEYYWFVDPLDGTKEFLKRSDEFTVNIALVYKLRPVIGVIGVPLWDTLYCAQSGAGSFKQKDGKRTRLAVTRRSQPEAVVVESRDHTPTTQKHFMDTFTHASKLAFGSSIKGCFVAEGKADLYLRLSPFWYWDVCAQDCIVTEAGGSCTDIAGNSIEYLPQAATVSGVVISNGVFHHQVIVALKD